MNRPSLDRLAELETLAPDEGCPEDARLSVPVGDLRDLLALIPIARAALSGVVGQVVHGKCTGGSVHYTIEFPDDGRAPGVGALVRVSREVRCG